MRWLRRFRGERGQVIILFVGIITVIFAIAAIVIDWGLWASERRGVQRAADFAALAGAQDLLKDPNSSADELAAIDNALQWAARNGYADRVDGVTVEPELLCQNHRISTPDGICSNSGPEPVHCDPNGLDGKGGNCDGIRVVIRKPATHLFSSIFGIGGMHVGYGSAAGVSVDVIPKDVVLVIDKTGSMGPNGGCTGTPCRTRIEWAKQAALAFVNEIAGGASSRTLGKNHIEVLTFDGDTTATLVVAFSSDAVAVRNAINGISNPEGDTYIRKGLDKATADLNTHAPKHSGSYKVVVLLSDGRNYVNGDQQSGTNCPATHTRRTNTVNAIPGLHAATDTVYTVGIGKQTGGAADCNPYELDTTLLTQIAQGPPGEYINVQEAKDLPEIFKMIAWKIAGRALTQ